MRLESLRLHDFRNYADVNVSFTDGIHILTGKNAQGKTNLLESILYLSTTRSHRTSEDKDLIKEGEQAFFIKALIAKEQKTEFVRLHLDTLCTTPAFTIPANVVQLERISVQHYAYLAEESVQKQNDDDTIVLTQIPFWDNGVGYISGKRNHLYVYYEESQTSKALFAGNWHVENLSVSNTQIVCSAQEYSTKKPLTQGIYHRYPASNRASQL